MTQGDALQQQGYQLHQELLAGDPTSTARIAEQFWQNVEARLLRRFSSLSDPHLVPTALADAFLSYFRRPSQYDPNRLSLASYLYMSAAGDLLNALASRAREISLTQSVELDADSAEIAVDAEDETDLEQKVLARLSPVFGRIDSLFPDPADQAMVRLLMEGERNTAEFAAVLAIQHLTADEQARVVKRHKDRLKKTLQRHQTELLRDE